MKNMGRTIISRLPGAFLGLIPAAGFSVSYPAYQLENFKNSTIVDVTPLPQSWDDTQIRTSSKYNIVPVPLDALFEKNVSQYTQKASSVIVGAEGLHSSLAQAATRLQHAGVNVLNRVMFDQQSYSILDLKKSEVQFTNLIRMGIQGTKNFTFLDVRSQEEYRKAHFKNSINIQDSKLPSSLGMLDRSQHYIVNCQSGRRALYAGLYLHSQGYKVSIIEDKLKKLLYYQHML